MADKWDTPILIMHGEKDYRISYTQSMQAFNAAQILGVPSKLVLFPDENHWISKPQNAIVWQREFFGWLEKYLK
jgi:dipeptidyl aminopeptidase/acylaminoacyl peptidase